MFDTVFSIKVRMSGLCINRYRPIIGHCLIGASLILTLFNFNFLYQTLTHRKTEKKLN